MNILLCISTLNEEELLFQLTKLRTRVWCLPEDLIQDHPQGHRAIVRGHFIVTLTRLPCWGMHKPRAGRPGQCTPSTLIMKHPARFPGAVLSAKSHRHAAETHKGHSLHGRTARDGTLFHNIYPGNDHVGQESSAGYHELQLRL